MRSYAETRCPNKQKTKTPITMKETEKYRVIYGMTCRTGCRSFRENLVDESIPLEPRGDPSPGHRDTSSSAHELPMESRAKVEAGSGVSTVSTTSYLRTNDCINNGYVTDILEHNTMINIDTGAHMILHYTQS